MADYAEFYRRSVSEPEAFWSEQAQLIDMDPARYDRPAYYGDGWIAIRLDLGDTDWDAIAEWLRRSWQAVAPKRLTALIDAANAF